MIAFGKLQFAEFRVGKILQCHEGNYSCVYLRKSGMHFIGVVSSHIQVDSN